MKHDAQVARIGWATIPGIAHPVSIWADVCTICGRPVRQVYGRQAAGSGGVLFWHAAGKAKPGDARLGPRRAEHSAAIGAGMRAATARRKERFG